MTGKSFVYAYHLPSLAAIKVGHGQNPEQRMESYTKLYKLTPARDTLHIWEVPSTGIASNIESACHTMLLSEGFDRAKVSDEDAEAKEIFLLGTISFPDAISLLVEEIDNNLQYLREALEGKSYSEQHARQQKAESVRAEREAKRKQSVDEIAAKIERGYQTFYSPFIKLLQEQKDFEKQNFQFKRLSLIDTLIRGKRFAYKTEQMYFDWTELETYLTFTPHVLKASRPCRVFFHDVHKEYDVDLIDEAQDKVGVDLWNFPDLGGVISQLPIPYRSAYKMHYCQTLDFAEYEVFMCTDIGTAKTFKEVLSNSPTLTDLVRWVRANPCLKANFPD